MDGRIILKWMFEKSEWRALNRFIWFRIGTTGRLL
jgi:hypothetical protein